MPNHIAIHYVNLHPLKEKKKYSNRRAERMVMGYGLNFVRACSHSGKLMRASLASVVSGNSLPFVRPQPHSVATLKASVASRLIAALLVIESDCHHLKERI